MRTLRWCFALLAVLVIGGMLAFGMSGRATAGTGGEKDVTIKTAGPDPGKVPLSKSHNDRVRWYNTDDRGHTLLFTDWPFLEAPEAIAIKAGEKSRWYTVYPNQSNGTYGYSIDPPLKSASQGPPEGPSVEVGE